MTAHHADLGGLPLAALDAREAALEELRDALDATTLRRVREYRTAALAYWMRPGPAKRLHRAETRAALTAGWPHGVALDLVALAESRVEVTCG